MDSKYYVNHVREGWLPNPHDVQGYEGRLHCTWHIKSLNMYSGQGIGGVRCHVRLSEASAKCVDAPFIMCLNISACKLHAYVCNVADVSFHVQASSVFALWYDACVGSQVSVYDLLHVCGVMQVGILLLLHLLLQLLADATTILCAATTIAVAAATRCSYIDAETAAVGAAAARCCRRLGAAVCARCICHHCLLAASPDAAAIIAVAAATRCSYFDRLGAAVCHRCSCHHCLLAASLAAATTTATTLAYYRKKKAKQLRLSAMVVVVDRRIHVQFGVLVVVSV